MRIAIVDDENQWINVIENYLIKLKCEISDIKWDAFYSGEELLKCCFENNRPYDIIIIDIELKGLSGIETANKIREQDNNVIIIFLTNYAKYMRNCFKCRASAFWEKPIEYEEFKNDMQNAIKNIKTNPDFFTFKYNRNEHRIPLDEIIYLNNDKRKVVVHTQYNEYELIGALKKYKELLLKHNFVFVHNSYCVNMFYVRKKSKSFVTLSDGSEIPISKAFKTDFENSYLNFITKESEL